MLISSHTHSGKFKTVFSYSMTYYIYTTVKEVLWLNFDSILTLNRSRARKGMMNFRNYHLGDMGRYCQSGLPTCFLIRLVQYSDVFTSDSDFLPGTRLY